MLVSPGQSVSHFWAIIHLVHNEVGSLGQIEKWGRGGGYIGSHWKWTSLNKLTGFPEKCQFIETELKHSNVRYQWKYENIQFYTYIFYKVQALVGKFSLVSKFVINRTFSVHSLVCQYFRVSPQQTRDFDKSIDTREHPPDSITLKLTMVLRGLSVPGESRLRSFVQL